MKKNRSPRKKRTAPKAILRLPDLDHAKAAVLKCANNTRLRKHPERPSEMTVTLREVGWLFLKLGFVGFGGLGRPPPPVKQPVVIGLLVAPAPSRLPSRTSWPLQAKGSTLPPLPSGHFIC